MAAAQDSTLLPQSILWIMTAACMHDSMDTFFPGVLDLTSSGAEPEQIAGERMAAQGYTFFRTFCGS
jgi:hypothetical protein